MAHKVTTTPEFAGFEDFRANVTFVPLQFFTLGLPYCSRGTARIVGYALRKVLGWVDAHGNPRRERLRFTYRELIEQAGVSRPSLAEALKEAIQRQFLICLQPPMPHAEAQCAQNGIYELRWDKNGRYTDDPAEFRGFYYPEAAIIEERDGASTVRRLKSARKNIPNAFFDVLLPRERLSVIRVVGALLFYSIRWGSGGERKEPVRRSITQLSRLSKLSRQHVHEAVMEAQRRGYIEQVAAGCFDPAAGRQSEPATYGIRWATHASQTQVEPGADGPSVRKGERDPQRLEMVNGESVRKGERERLQIVNGKQLKKVNGISIKTEHKTEQTAAAGEAGHLQATDATKAAAVGGLGFDMLVKAGFDATVAERLAHEYSREVIQRQVEWLSLRSPSRNRLGLLRRAIEQDWPKPESAPKVDETSPTIRQARLFASHYYAAYHEFKGEAATEPFPKDLEMAAGFIERLPVRDEVGSKVAEWGSRFGQFMRRRHQGDVRAKPHLSSALTLFGDLFLVTSQKENATRQRIALGKARETHEAMFRSEYFAYLRRAETELQQTKAALYEAFTAKRDDSRRLMSGGIIRLSARTLESFDTEESRLREFAEFFRNHPQHPVSEFWEWDARHNPRRFGGRDMKDGSTEAPP